MSEIETELVKASTFRKKRAVFTEYQEYLQALVMACDKITDDDFDNLSEAAADWYQEAVTAMNKKRDIPDFADAEPEEFATEEETVDEVEEVDEAAQVDEEAVEEEPAEETGEAAEEVEQIGAPTEETDLDPGDGQPISDEAPKTFPGPSKKQPRKPIKGRGKYIKKPNRKPPTQPKHKPGLEPDYKAITGKLDRYGITAGTKASMALKMFEKGHSMRDATIELGGTYYIVLRKLAKEGHKVERLKNGTFKLTHRDDVEKKVKGK